MAYDYLGHIYQDLNLTEAALAAHTQGLQTALSGQVGYWLPRLSANVALARLRLGDLEAVSELEVAFAVAMEDYQRFHAVRALEGLMEAGILRGEPERTLHFAGVLEGMCQMGDLRELGVQVNRWRSAAYRLLGQNEEAQRALMRAQADAAPIVRPRLHWELHSEAMALAMAQGKVAEAETHSAAMHTIAQRIADNLQNPALSNALFVAAVPALG
jgi:tetratricopeptide (TPR) repeat protein